MSPNPAESPSSLADSRSRPAWILAAGMCVMALGYASRQDKGNQTQTVPPMPTGATADSNNSMIAVTGVDLTGQSVLYLIDTVEPAHLAVYQASGGSTGTMGIKLVGARQIDLDLELEGFNDRTEDNGRPLKRADLERMFQEKGLAPAEK
jgi:hypothetical protein